MENEPDAPQAAPEPEPSPPPAPEPEPLRPNSTIEVRGGENPSKFRTNLVETHSDNDE